MKSVLERAIIPGPPTDAKVHVTSPTRATIEFTPPQQHGYPSTGWLNRSDRHEKTKINVDNLDRGQCYTFRIKAASMWGFGKFSLAFPKAIRISSWEDVDNLPNFRIEQMQK
uniref:Fibronectin type-III domain-containing protein n=1 Tax=Ditylenchus dipsaci TaxID=166011 RepID=A0A915E5D8_9BILA